MAQYLAEHEVRHAVEQLGRSSAKSRMCELLIGLRTLKLLGAEEVAIAESVPEYLRAVRELTLWAGDEETETPYFNPFGSQAGYKSRRFPSNGPSNTMHGWATQVDSPFEIVNTSPKSIRRRPVSQKQLRAFVLLAKKDAERPRLVDAAVWLYRSSDVERADGTVPDRGALEARFIEDMALSADDAQALFRYEDEDSSEDTAMPASSSDSSASAQAADPSEETGS